MGKWQLEVARMAMYLTFPVAMFHIFNQPEFFEEWVTNTRRTLYDPENKQLRNDLNQLVLDMQKKDAEEMLQAMKANEKY